MAGGGSSKSRKRVEATPADVAATGPSLVRAKDGRLKSKRIQYSVCLNHFLSYEICSFVGVVFAFWSDDECGKSVPVALISMHSCSLDAKIRMNLEAQTVEKQTQSKKPAEKKKSASSEPKAKKSRTDKKGKKDKDPNAPKRPPTAFFIFMDDFRKSFKEANPDSKGVKEVAKEGGEKWKSMTDEDEKETEEIEEKQVEEITEEE
ncbi:high mobility group B protein 7 [Cucumis melo var. makuwa]|uniref:High mobility group B protein 7 n=1 Tax=Cucumis melo var. makuwa TaxID=1194695 RepID=A0A5A7VD68_CUCMM|nr:high mobility group B protein 7 [Cucumis melo var. makuwa]TYK15163.1 high mobility group B protein 7 [Cucumis melo var. makuwa]